MEEKATSLYISISAYSQVSDHAKIGRGSRIGEYCIIEAGAEIGQDCIIESHAMIRSNARIGKGSYVGSGCIIGELQLGKPGDWQEKRSNAKEEKILSIGKNALIRSGTILYEASCIGNDFQTGHRVTMREGTCIGSHVRVGTLSDIQGHCVIGNYVHLHSNVHIGMKSEIEDYVWIFPYSVLTNDPTPPSENLQGAHVSSFAVICTGSIILPGVHIASDSLVGAGAVVTKDVEEYAVVAGNPAKAITDVRKVKDKRTGKDVYPWRLHFDRDMPWEGIGYQKWVRDELGR